MRLDPTLQSGQATRLSLVLRPRCTSTWRFMGHGKFCLYRVRVAFVVVMNPFYANEKLKCVESKLANDHCATFAPRTAYRKYSVPP